MGLGITAIAQDAISSLGTPNTIAAVTGVSLTTAIGQAQTDPDVVATGQQLTTAAGTSTITGTAVVSPTGNVITTSTGSLSITANAVVNVTGIPITINLGNSVASIDKEVDVTGVSLTSAIGTPTVFLETPVDVTGRIVIQQGSPLIISWSNVDPEVTNTLTEVDIAAT